MSAPRLFFFLLLFSFPLHTSGAVTSGDLPGDTIWYMHADLDAMHCLNCHQQNAETFALQSSKARGFHQTTIRNNLSCLRCHRGVAHGVPGWVEAIRKGQHQADD